MTGSHGAAPIECVVVDALTDQRWADLVESSDTDVFHSRPWLEALASTYGFDMQAVLLLDDSGAPVGGIPFSRVEGLPAPRVAAPPFSDFCDPIATTPAQWRLIRDALLAHEVPITVRCLHNDLPLTDDILQAANKCRWHGLNLDRPVESIWDGIDASARRAIRKARKEGVTVRPATDRSELRRFFELHLATRKYRYRLLAQPFALFENLWKQFVEAGTGSLMVALHDNEIIGAVFFLEWQDTLYYKFSASAAAGMELRPNDLIIWESIEAAQSRGLRRLDFGLSDWDQDGLVRYKRKYATEEKTISFMRNPAAAPHDTRAGQTRSILPQLTDLLTAEEVPDAVTERAGELLYGLFA